MAVKLFFGLPGCGKTTLLTYFAKKATGKRSPYKHVYSNVGVSVPGVTYIDNDCIVKHELRDALILLDEATLFADSRNYKEFSKEKIYYFLMHRHYNVDLYLFTQQWDGVDRKIRVITDKVYYVYKSAFLGKWFSSYYRIPYGIIIPDPNKKGGTSGEKLGEIIQGYCKPSFFVRLFATKIFRPKYYKYFDSWECKKLPPLPARYQAYFEVKEKDKKIFDIFLRLKGLKSLFPYVPLHSSDDEGPHQSDSSDVAQTSCPDTAQTSNSDLQDIFPDVYF